MSRQRGRITRTQIATDQTKQSDQLATDETEIGEATEDLEILRDLDRELEREGTSEGADRTDSSIRGTRDVARGVHAERDATIERDQETTREYSGDLDDRAGRDQSDLDRIDAADKQLHVGDSKSEISQTRDAVREDKDYLDEKVAEFRKRSEESKAIAADLRRRAQNASR